MKKYKVKQDWIVTKGKWSYSVESGSDLPSGMVRVTPFYFTKSDKQVKAKHYGQIIPRGSENEFGLKHGYLQKIKKGTTLRFRR